MEIFANREIETDLNLLQKWFEANENLPEKIDRIFLARFYYRSDKNIEETKKLLLGHYAIRKKNPNIFFARDPDSQHALNTAEFVHFVTLPGLTPDKNQVKLIKLKNADPNKVHFVEDMKSLIMAHDGAFCEADMIVNDVPYFAENLIQIVDMDGFTMKHMTHLSLPALLVFLRYMQKYCPIKFKTIHLINCPAYVNNMFAMVKPFMKKETIDKIQFHVRSIENLFESVPKEMLPSEYGGNSSSIDDLSEEMLNSLRSKRNYLIDPNYWKITDESK
ncbi:alpha-tocopherol transfer protein-like [Musca vetustissima]|uniref:alpha-tocopherol transfer protein-like n=1 Tax=Musca vetustissima TaxID=27455 RepID=UPI002AB77343|nr:alpha-tocopherol transfer protein-like [Musca vetustissima]